MKRTVPFVLAAAALLASLGSPGLLRFGAAPLYGKQKAPPIGPDDPTLKLFQLLDTSYGGKLADFYFIADIYKDPKRPNEEFQRVLRVEYDKNRSYGKLAVHVRSVGKMQPEQLKAYTPKMVFEYGVEDAEKFVKTDPGPFGRPGDDYLRSGEDRPLARSPITDEVRKAYEHLVTDLILPAVQKK